MIRLRLCVVGISSVQFLSRVQLFVTPWTAAHQASLSTTNSRSLGVVGTNIPQFFFKKIFDVDHFKKFFVILVTILFFCFLFWFFDHAACESLAPQPRIEPEPPALEGQILATGLPGKSQ